MSTTKQNYPFRLGCTSYVIPDDIIPNVKRIGPLVDDVELVLFESPDHSNIPSEQDIDILAQLATNQDITYTVHLPIDRKAGARSVDERISFVKAAQKIIHRTRALNPYGYVLHFEGIRFDSPTEDVLFWRNAIQEVCVHLVSSLEVDSQRICVENLGYPTEWHLELVHRFDFSFCFDIGHLWLYGVENWMDIVQACLQRTRIIHLHGVERGKDHLSLTRGPRENIIQLIDKILPLYNGVVTLEVFTEQDTLSSLQMVKELWER